MQQLGISVSADVKDLDRIVDLICEEFDHPNCAGDKARLRERVSQHVFAYGADGVQADEIKRRVIAELIRPTTAT